MGDWAGSEDAIPCDLGNDRRLAIGKTPKPLTILYTQALEGNPALAELEAKGHTLIPINVGCDLLIGPECARFLPGMEKFLEDFIKGARKVKYPKEPR